MQKTEDTEEDDIDFSKMSAYQLIDWLHGEFPHSCIGPADTIRQADRYAGRRELIDELRRAKEIELAAKDDE